MSGVIEQAYVSILPKIDPNFSADVLNQVNATLGRVGDKASTTLNRSLSTAGKQGGQALAQGIGDGAKQAASSLDAPAAAAEKTSSRIDGALRGSAQRTSAAFNTAGKEIEAEAKRAGNSLEKDLGGGAERAEGPLKRVSGALKVAGGLLAAKVGVDFFKGAIESATQLQDTTGALNVIIGQQGSKIIQDFAAKSARAFGISQTAALNASQTFATFGKSAGLSGADLGKFSTKFTALAGDLASFNGGSTQDAIDAIGAALRGEAEPIRRYGVLLDDASLRQEALAQGLIKTTKQALTPQQKVLASQALIFKKTKDAQGDFARTSNSAANSQKALSATLADVKTKIGSAILPLVTNLTQLLLRGLTPAFEAVQKVAGPAFAAVQKIVKDAFSFIQSQAGLLSGLFQPLVDAAHSLPAIFDTIKSGFFGIGTGADGATGAFARIGAAAKQVGDAVGKAFSTVGPILATAFSKAQPIIAKVFYTLKQLAPVVGSVAASVGKLLAAAFNELQKALSIAGAVLNSVLLPALSQVASVVSPIVVAIAKATAAILKFVAGNQVVRDIVLGVATAVGVYVAAVKIAAAVSRGYAAVTKAIAAAQSFYTEQLSLTSIQVRLLTIQERLRAAGQKVAAAATAVFTAVQAGLQRAIEVTRIKTIASTAATVASAVAMKVVQVATIAFTAAQAALNAVLAINPFILIGVAVVALAAGLVLLYKRSATFRAIIQKIGDVIGSVVVPVFNALKKVLSVIGPFIAKAALFWLKFLNPIGLVITAIRNFSKIKDVLIKVGNSIKTFIGNAVSFFGSLAGKIGTALLSLGKTLFDVFSKAFLTLAALELKGLLLLVKFWIDLPGRIFTALKTLGSTLAGVFNQAFLFLGKIVHTGVDAVVNYVTGIPGRTVAGLKNIGSIVGGIFSKAFGGLKGLVSGAINGVVSTITGLPGKIAGLGGSLLKAGTGLATSLLNGLKGLPGQLLGVIKAAFSALGNLGGFLKDSINNALHLPLKFGGRFGVPSFTLIPRLAQGAVIDKATQAIVGEAGREVVIPLTRTRRAVQLVQESGLLKIPAVAALAARTLAPKMNSDVERYANTPMLTRGGNTVSSSRSTSRTNTASKTDARQWHDNRQVTVQAPPLHDPDQLAAAIVRRLGSAGDR